MGPRHFLSCPPIAPVLRSCRTTETASAGNSTEDLTDALRNVSRNEKTSLFTIFAAALDTLLYRYSGSDDILIGIPLADRDHAELQNVVGYLLRMHVLRTRLSGEMTFRESAQFRSKVSARPLYTSRRSLRSDCPEASAGAQSKLHARLSGTP